MRNKWEPGDMGLGMASSQERDRSNYEGVWWQNSIFKSETQNGSSRSIESTHQEEENDYERRGTPFSDAIRNSI